MWAFKTLKNIIGNILSDRFNHIISLVTPVGWARNVGSSESKKLWLVCWVSHCFTQLQILIARCALIGRKPLEGEPPSLLSPIDSDRGDDTVIVAPRYYRIQG